MAVPLVPMERKSPFEKMKIDDNSILHSLSERTICKKCKRSRKFFCYNCFLPIAPLENKVPVAKLPIKIDIIKHKKEVDGKSTAVHAKILASEDVNIYTYPDIPDYSKEEKIFLLFPSSESITVSSLFNGISQYKMKEREKGLNVGTLMMEKLDDIISDEEKHKLVLEEDSSDYNWDNLPIKKAVLIDSTWNQCRGIYKDNRIRSIKSIIIQSRPTQFWRHQRNSPRFFLSTIEAIHQLLLEIHISAWGLNRNYLPILDDLELSMTFIPEGKIFDSQSHESHQPYNGQYDNLLYFFTFMYDLIHKCYDHSKLLSYKRPFSKGV